MLEIDAGKGRRFRVLDRLGAGGMGEVYLAHAIPSGARVAIKVARAELGERGLARFQREADLLRAVRSPHVGGFLDMFHDGAQHCLVMEYVEGTTLEASLQDSSPAPATRVALVSSLREGLCNGLSALHGAGIVHRDIKPANILLAPGRGAVLVDLGLARGPSVATLTRTGAALGTPRFWSPELIAGEVAGPASDLYQVGLVLTEVLVGLDSPEGQPAVAMALARARQIPADLRDQAPWVPASLAAWVRAALHPDPSLRPPVAEHLAGLVSLDLEASPEPVQVARESDRAGDRTTGRVFRTLPQGPDGSPGRMTQETARLTSSFGSAPVPSPPPSIPRVPHTLHRLLLVALLLGVAVAAFDTRESPPSLAVTTYHLDPLEHVLRLGSADAETSLPQVLDLGRSRLPWQPIQVPGGPAPRSVPIPPDPRIGGCDLVWDEGPVIRLRPPHQVHFLVRIGSDGPGGEATMVQDGGLALRQGLTLESSITVTAWTDPSIRASTRFSLRDLLSGIDVEVPTVPSFKAVRGSYMREGAEAWSQDDENRSLGAFPPWGRDLEASLLRDAGPLAALLLLANDEERGQAAYHSLDRLRFLEESWEHPWRFSARIATNLLEGVGLGQGSAVTLVGSDAGDTLTEIGSVPDLWLGFDAAFKRVSTGNTQNPFEGRVEVDLGHRPNLTGAEVGISYTGGTAWSRLELQMATGRSLFFRLRPGDVGWAFHRVPPEWIAPEAIGEGPREWILRLDRSPGLNVPGNLHVTSLVVRLRSPGEVEDP